MAMNTRADSFLEDCSPLSEALIGAQADRREQSVSASNVYITIEKEKCFRCFDSAFHNIWLLANDNSSTMSAAEIKNKFFFGSVDNIRVVWDYCMLSKLEAESSFEVLDESDEMQLEIFKQLESFYTRHKTFPVHMDQDIMDLFRYYCARDVILEASKHLEKNNEETLVDSEKEDMDTDFLNCL